MSIIVDFAPSCYRTFLAIPGFAGSRLLEEVSLRSRLRFTPDRFLLTIPISLGDIEVPASPRSKPDRFSSRNRDRLASGMTDRLRRNPQWEVAPAMMVRYGATA